MSSITPQLRVGLVTAVAFLGGCAGSGSGSSEQPEGVTTSAESVSIAASTARSNETRPPAGPSRKIELRSPQNELVGAVLLRAAARDRLRIELDVGVELAPRWFPAKVVIYGHETSDFTMECDAINLVANTGGSKDVPGIAELLDAGLFPSPTSTRVLNASFRAITADADSIALWWQSELLGCGDF